LASGGRSSKPTGVTLHSQSTNRKGRGISFVVDLLKKQALA